MCVCSRTQTCVKSSTLAGSLLAEVHWRNAEAAALSSSALSPVTAGPFFKLPGARRGEIWREVQQEDVEGQSQL